MAKNKKKRRKSQPIATKPLMSIATENILSWSVLSVLIIAAIALFSYQIDRSWIGHHDFNGAVWSNIARNFNRYGFLATKFGQVNNYGSLTPETFNYYIHHPPLLPILLALSFRLFGESEVVARSVPIVFSLGAIVFMFLITKRLWGTTGAIIGTLALLATPQFLYFGKMVDHEALTFSFILAATYFYIKWLDQPLRVWLIGLYFMVILGGLSGWPAYYFMMALFVYDIVHSKRVRPVVLMIPIIGGLLLVMFVIHISILKDQTVAIKDIMDIFKVRAGISSPLNWQEWAAKLATRMGLEFTWPFVLLSLSGLAAAIVMKSLRSGLALGMIAILMFVGLVHVFLFPHGASNHDYWLYYLLAPMAVAAGAWGTLGRTRLTVGVVMLSVALVLLGGEAYKSYSSTSNLYSIGADNKTELLGTLINQFSDLEDTTVLSIDLPDFRPLVEYYADRKLIWGIDSIAKFDEVFAKNKNLVFFDAGQNRELSEYLQSKYQPERALGIGIVVYDVE